MRSCITIGLVTTTLMLGAGREPLPQHGTAPQGLFTPGPPAQLEHFNQYLGEWTIEGTVDFGGGNWNEVSGTSSWELMLGGSAIRETTTLDFGPDIELAFEVVHSYDVMLGRYRSVYTDNVQSLADVYECDGVQEDGRMVMSNSGLCVVAVPVEGGAEYRHAFVELNPVEDGSFVWEWKIDMDDGPLDNMKLTFTRVE